MINLSKLTNRHYGLFFLNYTGIPTILEELIIREIKAKGEVPIMLVDRKYISHKKYVEGEKANALELIDILETFIYKDIENLFAKLSLKTDQHKDSVQNNPKLNALGFQNINCFNSTIYYSPKQFQVETYKEDVVINSQEFKNFFYSVKKVKMKKEKVLSYEPVYKYESLKIEKGNYEGKEIIEKFFIRYKESAFCKCLLKDSVQIGRLNQSYKDNPDLLSSEVYEYLKDR